MAKSIAQSASFATASSATTTATFGSSVAAGSTVVVLVACHNSALLNTPTDNKGNVYHLALNRTLSNGGQVAIYFAYNVTGGAGFAVSEHPNTFCCCGPTPPAVGLVIYEIQGFTVTTTTFDQSSGNVATGTAVTTNATAATTQADEALIGMVGASLNVSGNFTVGAGYSNLVNVNPGNSTIRVAGETQIVAATGTYTATFTSPSNAAYGALIATFGDVVLSAAEYFSGLTTVGVG